MTACAPGTDTVIGTSAGSGGDGGTGGSTTATSAGGGGAGGESVAGGGAGGGGGTGTGGAGGGMGLLDCIPGQEPYTGPLCGPPELPCLVLSDTELPDALLDCGEPPAIAATDDCATHVAYCGSGGLHVGKYAVRAVTGEWEVETIDGEVSSTSLAVAPDGVLHALVDDWSTGVHLRARVPGGWTTVSALPGQVSSGNAALAFDEMGVAHVAYYKKEDQIAHAALGPDGWVETVVAVDGNGAPSLALDYSGSPQVLFQSGKPDWVWRLAAPPPESELIAPLGGTFAGLSNPARHAVIPNGDTVIVYRQILAGGTMALQLARRSLEGTLQVTTLDTGAPDPCSAPPTEDGQICVADWAEVNVIGVVASAAGSARAFYGKRHHLDSYVGDCFLGECTWEATATEETSEVRVGWVDAAGQAHTALVMSGVGEQGGVGLDPGGRVHLVLKEHWPGDQPFHHYLVGP